MEIVLSITSILSCSFIAMTALAQAAGLSQSRPFQAKKTGCPASSEVEKRALTYECELNCGVLDKPLPEYPAIASAARVSGEVVVEIIVDRTGQVVATRPVSGHPLLIQSALAAACRIRYRPLRVSGRVVAFKTKAKYNFKLAELAQPSNRLEPTARHGCFVLPRPGAAA